MDSRVMDSTVLVSQQVDINIWHETTMNFPLSLSLSLDLQIETSVSREAASTDIIVI
jgi:hypothetical protein